MQSREWAEKQRALLAQHEQWVSEEGGMELPVQLDTYFTTHQQHRLDWLKQYVFGTVLEVGCSWGYVLGVVGGHAGVDINPGLVTMAQLLAPSRKFTVADARTLPYSDKTYDTIILSEVLEHLPFPNGVVYAVNEARRVAKYQLLITLPHPDSDEASSHKHQWLVGEPEIAEMITILGEKTTISEDGKFWYLRTLL